MNQPQMAELTQLYATSRQSKMLAVDLQTRGVISTNISRMKAEDTRELSVANGGIQVDSLLIRNSLLRLLRMTKLPTIPNVLPKAYVGSLCLAWERTRLLGFADC